MILNYKFSCQLPYQSGSSQYLPETIVENEMERTIEELERQCRDKINSSLRSSEDTQIQKERTAAKIQLN